MGIILLYVARLICSFTSCVIAKVHVWKNCLFRLHVPNWLGSVIFQLEISDLYVLPLVSHSSLTPLCLWPCCCND